MAEAVQDFAQSWSICGGHDYSGPTTCTSDYICAYIDKWYSQCISAALPKFQKTCASSGQAEADIAGIGVLIALGVQTGFSFLFMVLAGPIVSSDPSPAGRAKTVVLNCLLANIDTQIITGIALITSTLSTWHTLDLYHFHIAHSMISISCALIYPSIYRVFSDLHRLHPRPGTLHRTLSSLLLLLLYTIQTALFGHRLSHWSPNSPRNCFEGHTLLRPSTSLPSTSPPPRTSTSLSFHHNFTLAVIAILFIFPFLFTLFLSHNSRHPTEGAKFRKNRWFCGLWVVSIILIALHASFIRELKSSDQHFLPPGDSEDRWGFGQIVVMFSFVPMLFQIYLELREKFGGDGVN